MQSIDVAAREYAIHMAGSDSYEQNDLENGFKAGVEFTHHWLDIDKEIPDYYQPILADNGKYMAVVARVSDGDEDSYTICGTDFYMNPNPIKWRPIELK